MTKRNFGDFSSLSLIVSTSFCAESAFRSAVDDKAVPRSYPFIPLMSWQKYPWPHRMMANPLTHSVFAVAGGAGNIGAFVTTELIAQGATVVVLSRKEVAVPAGATLSVVDYQDEASIVAALRKANVEIVISTLSGGGFAVQTVLVSAAKQAGVKLFVPSEFGMRSTELPADFNLLGPKNTVIGQARALGLPTVLIWVGLFTDWFFTPTWGFDFANRKLTFVGEGTTPISWTSRKSISRFVAYALTHLTTERLANATLRVEDEKLSMLQVAERLQEIHGPLEIAHRDAGEVAHKVEVEGVKAAVDWILLAADRGYLDIGQADTNLVPDWEPVPFKEAAQQQAESTSYSHE